MAIASPPAGWYRDPSARHQRRYWDGTTWSSHVLDGAAGSEDPLNAVGPFGAALATQRGGYRAVRIGLLRYLAAVLALLILLCTFMFELFSWLIAFGTTTRTTDEDFLKVVTWLYSNPSSWGAMQYIGRPPILVIVASLVAFVALGSAVSGTRAAALQRAGAKMARWFSSADHKAQWAYLQARLAGAGVRWTVGARKRDYTYLVVAILSSATLIGLAWLALSERSAFDVLGEPVTIRLRVGLGPWLCLVAGIAGILGSLAAWPFGSKILIHEDGSVEDPAPG